MAPAHGVGDKVRCESHRFNEPEADRNGLFFADRHRALGHGEYCFGIVKHAYSSRNAGPQMYRMLYDGDRTQMKSAEEHLTPDVPDDPEDDGSLIGP
jgi:hypothetical protein